MLRAQPQSSLVTKTTSLSHQLPNYCPPNTVQHLPINSVAP